MSDAFRDLVLERPYLVFLADAAFAILYMYGFGDITSMAVVLFVLMVFTITGNMILLILHIYLLPVTMKSLFTDTLRKLATAKAPYKTLEDYEDMQAFVSPHSILSTMLSGIFLCVLLYFMANTTIMAVVAVLVCTQLLLYVIINILNKRYKKANTIIVLQNGF